MDDRFYLWMTVYGFYFNRMVIILAMQILLRMYERKKVKFINNLNGIEMNELKLCAKIHSYMV